MRNDFRRSTEVELAASLEALLPALARDKESQAAGHWRALAPMGA